MKLPDRTTIASLIPLLAVCIFLADYLFDHTQPRYASPWFWVSLVAIAVLLMLIQVLRFVKSSPSAPSKPDLSATTIIRRKSTLD